MLARLSAFVLIGLWVGTVSVADGPASPSAEPANADATDDSDADKQLFKGKVVLVAQALKRRGIRTYDELKGQVALETDSGELLPIVPDWRGRAFFQDERLRNRKVELIASKRPGLPYLQVIMIFLFDETGRRCYMDYWCDICSIPMYEIKPCDCCQGDIRLRLQPRALPAYLGNSKGLRTPQTKTEGASSVASEDE